MTRRNVFLTIGAAALAIAIAVPVAFSRGPGGGEGHHQRFIEKLGLNEKQAADLQILKADHRDDAESLREQMQLKRTAIRSLWLAPSPDKQQILAAEREILALEGQLAESRIDFMFRARAILTPEQFGKFIEMRKHHGGKRGWGKHHRGGKHAPDSPDVER